MVKKEIKTSRESWTKENSTSKGKINLNQNNAREGKKRKKKNNSLVL